MTDVKKLIIFLSQFDLTNSKIEKILNFLGDKASIKQFTKAKLVENDILKAENYQKMLEMADEEFVKTFVINQAERGIKIVCKFDEEYPKKLFPLHDAPCILYYMGDISLANKPSLSVVGTRKPTNYGRMVTEKIVSEVASAGVVIVSGLAYGVDSIAHRKCLEVGGKTIAVLGGGFDNIYPSEHKSLAEEIAEKGLLLSEYRPKKRATQYTFPTRNRIVAGLGDGVLITEASLKSGTIHTKDFALDFGKNIYAVPGNIDSSSSALPNEILKSGQAEFVVSAKDILKDYDIKEVEKEDKNIFNDLSEEEQKIISQLQDGAKTIDELTKNCNLSINIFNTYLTTLEISGIIKRMPGGFITLS